MKKVLLTLLIITGIALWWFLPFVKKQFTGPVNTNLPDKIDTIVLISIDTIRADHVSCYGYKHRTTPNIDRIAKDSMFIQDAFSTIPLTLPAHCSMLTGLIPPTHGVHDNFEMRLLDEIVTLPEIMKDNGFSTYGIISSVVLDSRFGMDQGFDVFDDAFTDQDKIITTAERKGKETTENALKWLADNHDKKKFMFIHYYDPHISYEPPEPFSKQFAHPYDGEIAFTDHCIGKVIDKLKSLKLYEDALIVIVGDHGEMLGEHNEMAHSFFIYQNAIRVPMMFKLPRNAYVVKIIQPCSIIDIPPTILSLSGIDIPKNMQGINLLTLAQNITGKTASVPESYLKLANCYKKLELYHKQIEALNMRLKLKPNDLGTLQLLAVAYKNAGETDRAIEYTKKILAQLPGDLEFTGFLAGLYTKQGSHVLAIPLFLQKLSDKPEDINTLKGLADAYMAVKDYKHAIETLQIIAGLEPRNAMVYDRLALNYYYLKKYPETVQSCLKTLELEPKHLKAHLCLSQTYLRMNKLKQAVAQYELALKLKPDMVLPHNIVAWLQVTQTNPELYNPESALVHAQKAAELTLDNFTGKYTNPGILDTLAVAQAANGQFDTAAETASLAIEISLEKGLNSLAQKIQKRLDLYKQQKAYRE